MRLPTFCRHFLSRVQVDKFPANDGIIFVYPLDKTLLRGFSCSIMFGNKGCEGGENYVAEDLDGAFLRLCLFLSQLVATGIAHW